MKLDDTLHGISTLLLVTFQGKQIQGTGFFYQELAPRDPTKNSQWRRIEALWIVSNRHIFLPKIEDKEIVPDSLTFHIRKIADNSIIWEAITLDIIELRKRIKLHADPQVDVAMIRIDDLFISRIKDDKNYMQLSAVGEENLPGNNNISAEVADDVVIIGYPKGFYDEKNVFPIAKSGIIATRWGLNFNGLPVFLIDAKLFPGSSGSIVITKPIDFVIVDGKPMSAKDKKFAFLGVYSGEPFRQHTPIDLDDITIIRKDSSFNVGIVWYGQLVVDIAKKGIPLPDHS
jgi:hypothetical protein